MQSMPCVLRGKGKNVKMNTLNVYRKIRQSRRKRAARCDQGMFEQKEIQKLDDYFLPLSRRPGGGCTFFYRISGYSSRIEEFTVSYFQAAVKKGAAVEGRIPNPTEQNLSYYEEIMGNRAGSDVPSITSDLKKWLPRMADLPRNSVASALADVLEQMKRKGKNENMLRNAYIKYMCWLYYRFEQVANRLGQEEVPKILYEGSVNAHELNFLSVLSKAGCDIVLLQYQGDGAYQRLDPSSQLSRPLDMPGLSSFPQGFSLKSLRESLEQKKRDAALYAGSTGGAAPQRMTLTNVWISGKGLEDVLCPADQRGERKDVFCNCFLRISGVWDRMTYLNDLYKFQSDMKQAGRRMVISEGGVPKPSVAEIGAVQRGNYDKADRMIADLTKNIIFPENMELQKIMRSAFVTFMLEEEKQEDMNLSRLTNRAVYLLCWIRRYQGDLFRGWKKGDISCFLCLGGCRDQHEAAFLRYLTGLPADVLILVPDRSRPCCLQDAILYEISYDDSLKVDHFPGENSQLRMSTVAYQAERELDTILYQDSGMYRDHQYQKAVSVTLQSTYEEIGILWDEEVKYRPNFRAAEDRVDVPVIFAKVSGVKEGQVQKYWADIRKLVTPNSFVISRAPFLRPEDRNPVKAHVSDFFRNGKIQKAKLKSHSCYRYGFLREEVQEHILEKLQMLIDRRLIRGTFENGTEYTIVAVVLNLEKDILRLIQGFDFTKKNPKLIYINTAESVISLEDTILAAFLNLIGFDVVFFVPTGYQCVEKYFSTGIMEEHLIGDYVYDLTVPDFSRMSPDGHLSWMDRIFNRRQ